MKKYVINLEFEIFFYLKMITCNFFLIIISNQILGAFISFILIFQ
jgi:hypothetical protein